MLGALDVVAFAAAVALTGPLRGLHLVLLLVLSLLVTRQRRKHKVLIGDGGVAELALARMVEERPISEDELKRMRRILDELARDRKRGGK